MTIHLIPRRRRRQRASGRRLDAVLFADEQVRSAAGTAPDGCVLLGLAAGGRPVFVDLDNRDSTLAVYTGAGGGGSSILRSLTAQAVHAGATATVIDTSRHQRWARGLPGIDYVTDIPTAHERLVALGARARGWAEDSALVVDHGHPPRHLVVLDNATIPLHYLRRWWDDNRPGPGAPRRSPALTALEDLLFMGRAARISVLLCATSALPTTALGVEARAALTTPLLGRVTRATWQMTTGHRPPAPGPRQPGRVHVAWPDQVIETQALYMTDPEARHHAVAATAST